MSDGAKNKREWIKTAAIIFLSVMLVLTFFSQTIMNYSLPIVTAQYVSSGTVSAKVRGNGVIEAADLYNVQIEETREILSIDVKKGDTVEKDQVIMHLKDKESDELKKAQEELEKLQTDYKKALLSGDISNYVYTDAVAGKESTTDVYRTQIKAASDKVDSLDAQLLALNSQKTNGTYDSAALDISISNAKTALSNAEANLNSIKSVLSASSYGNASEAKSAMDNMAAMLESSRIAKEQAQVAMSNEYDTVSKVQQIYDKRVSDEANFATWFASLDSSFDTAKAELSDLSAAAILAKLGTLNETYSVLADDYKTAQANYNKDYALYSSAAEAYNNYSQLGAAQSAYDSAKANCDNLANTKNNASLTGADLEKKITQLTAEKTKAAEELAQLLKDIPAEIDLNSTAVLLKEKEEEVAELLEKSVGATIKAPVAGTIDNINVVSGGKCEAGSTLCTIQPSDKGFSLKVPVTAEQAKKVTIGTIADIQNSWYYSDITAELKSIQNDPDNPGRSKLLVFDVSGDVTNGQSLSVSVGSKAANYDLIVPNSAIREDNNGKFILIVESKSSPIGNRYFASRVDVDVLASDDTTSAISAALYGYEFVITTSTKPVEAGKQIRLAD